MNSTTPNVICIVLNKRYFAFTFPIDFAMAMSPQAASGLDGVSASRHKNEAQTQYSLHHPCLLRVLIPKVVVDTSALHRGGNRYNDRQPCASLVDRQCGWNWKGKTDLVPQSRPPRASGLVRSGSSIASPHGGEKSIWLHYPCFLGVPMVGRNQPSKEWMWWKRAKNGRKLVKLGENPNIPYPECERSIKIPVVKQQ